MSNMMECGQALHCTGVLARIKFMGSGDYSLKRTDYTPPKKEKDVMDQALTVHGSENRDYVKNTYIPGKKLGDYNPILAEATAAGLEKSLALYNKNYSTLEKMATNTITKEQVDQIKKQVPAPKNNSREYYSKDNLFNKEVKKTNSIKEVNPNVVTVKKSKEAQK